MIKSKTACWPLFAATLFLAAACGKKDGDVSSRPSMSVPVPVAKVAAQAEVKASSGPVELSYLVNKTQLRAGESIWHQIRIQNIGDKNIIVGDSVFHEPGQLREQSDAQAGIYIEAVGPDGRPLKVNYLTPAGQSSHLSDDVSGMLEVVGPEEHAMVDGWKKQGLNSRDINKKILEFNIHKQNAKEITSRLPAIELLPGQASETKSAYFYSKQDEIHKRPVPVPIGQFAQVEFFDLSRPGIYKVRAVYDGRQGELSRQAGIPAYPWDVLIRTPWIAVTVLP